MTTNTCAHCGKDIIPSNPTNTGYGVDKDDRKICFSCCGELDWQAMDKSGKYTLYLSKDSHGWKVTNWPGTLEFRASVTIHKYGHFSPFAGYMERRDCWFRDHAGHLWHGRSIGDWTQLVHCKRLKDTPDNLSCAQRIAVKTRTRTLERKDDLKHGAIHPTLTDKRKREKLGY